LQKGNLESLLDKAKKLEKKYEWLQAAKYYRKAADLVAEKEVMTAADLHEKMGFCYYRAALQAQQPEQNRKRMNLAIKAYEASVRFIAPIKERQIQPKINHKKGWIFFLKSWLEKDLAKKKILLDEWVKFWNKNLDIYTEENDLHSIGKVCNTIIESSAVDRFFISIDKSELEEITNECIRLGEKAINIFSKENKINELARAYCWASWYYGFCVSHNIMDKKREEFGQKSLEYSKKAVELSQKTGDAWLIGWSNNSASHSYISYERDLKTSIEYIDNFIKQGKIAKDNYMLTVGLGQKGNRIFYRSNTIEDPDKQKEGFQKALELNEEGKLASDLSNFYVSRLASRNFVIRDLEKLVAFETNQELKRALLEKIIKIAKENLALVPSWYLYVESTYRSLSLNLYKLSEILTDIDEKEQYLIESLDYREKTLQIIERFMPSYNQLKSYDNLFKAQIQLALAKIEGDKEKKRVFLKAAVFSTETCINLIEESFEDESQEWITVLQGQHRFQIGNMLYNLYCLTGKETLLSKANEAFDIAIKKYQKTKLFSNLAESYWQKAQIKDQLGEQLKSSKNYQLASNAYTKASEKLPKLKEFYINYSTYMKAWSEIELAKYNHFRENYLEAKTYYEKAAGSHQKLDDWNYLSPNYFAWAKLEQAEESSRKEKPKEAIENFQKAIEYFKKTETNIKTKINENPTAEEKDLMTGILKASDLRQRYCQARILMEEAKLLDREGKFFDSSKKYNEASQKISEIVDKVDNDIERNELKYISILCQAWEKMTLAEEMTSSESYLEAAELFENAKEHCFTKKASLWVLGNSSFCRGLAAGIEYQSSVDLTEHSKAKSLLKSAANSYLQAGFKQASEYAKATQRLFDAYAYMNQAENELDQEKRAKQYQMAENLLQIAAGSFMKAKQPEKTAQVQDILANVREEKALAISLGQVMQAPSIASTTLSFKAPTPTSEVSIGLESFDHANVQANLISTLKEVKVGESFCLSVEFVNAGREPALLMRVDDFVPSDFIVVKKPEIYRLEDTTLNMKGKQLAPLKFVEVKLTLHPSKKGKYQLNPRVYYLDELGQNKTLQLKTLEIQVEEVLLEDRVSTGTKELDSLLLGGIPSEYAVVLTGPPSDERDLLIKNFLDAGVKGDQITFYVSTEADSLETLLENPNFYLFLCNPKPKSQVPDLPNVYKLRSKTDLTNLSISLAKAYRNIDQSRKKRICVEIVSNVLLDYEARATCKWISELITDLGAKGFTMLAVMDPKEHPPDQATTVINLFDGEIELTQTEDPLECRKSVRVKKLRNQDYIKNPICLM